MDLIFRDSELKWVKLFLRCQTEWKHPHSCGARSALIMTCKATRQGEQSSVDYSGDEGGQCACTYHPSAASNLGPDLVAPFRCRERVYGRKIQNGRRGTEEKRIIRRRE
jgi:hypothetical protein